MFVIRTDRIAHVLPSVARAVACLRELASAGHDVTVTDAAGRRLDAAALIARARAGAPARPAAEA